MFCRNNQYLKIQKVHKALLKVVFNSDDGYDELLQMSNELPLTRNIIMYYHAKFSKL